MLAPILIVIMEKSIVMETITRRAGKTRSVKEKTHTGLSAASSELVARELNQLLADEVVLYIKTLNFHWNIEGEGFHAMHVFLEEQYNKLQELIDGVAERIRKVGHYASGSMKEFMKDASLKETSGGKITPYMLAELAAGHDAIIRNARELINKFTNDYDDSGSADFVTGLMRDHEKMSWMLHASLK